MQKKINSNIKKRKINKEKDFFFFMKRKINKGKQIKPKRERLKEKNVQISA